MDVQSQSSTSERVQEIKEGEVEGFKVPPIPVRKTRPPPRDGDAKSMNTVSISETSPSQSETPILVSAEDSSSRSSAETQVTAESNEHASSENDKTTAIKGSRHSTSGASVVLSTPPPLPYNEPQWSTCPSSSFFLSVIKNGVMIQEIPLSKKPFHVFGRLPSCDVQLEHPSISRHHAVLQYRPHDKSSEDSQNTDSNPSILMTSSSVSTNPKEKGFYVFDLGSTHGTFINKTKIQARCFYRLRVGQMVKFGGSSRLFLLEGDVSSQEDVEAAAEAEIKEIVQQKEGLEQRKAELEARQRIAEKEKEEVGVSWGIMTDDLHSMLEDEGEEYEIDAEKEAVYKDDPKKALKKFFDREGLELEYETEEEGPPRAKIFTVRVRLPIDTANGEAVYAEASVKGKKKDAVLQCALNACRMLDAQDMLRHHAKSHKRKERDWAENDYYDSDEDTFLDRTGTIERKRKKRMKKAGALKDSAENYESLESKLKLVVQEIASIEKKLAFDSQEDSGLSAEIDPLEAYMANVGCHLDKGKRLDLKNQLHDLKNERQRIVKLMELVKQTNLPELKSPTPMESPDEKAHSRTVLPTITRTDDEVAKVPTKTTHPPSTQSPSTHPAEQRSPPAAAPAKKKPRLIGPAARPPTEPSVGANDRNSRDQKFEDTEEFTDWLFPEEQSGDGRTRLNDKYGY